MSSTSVESDSASMKPTRSLSAYPDRFRPWCRSLSGRIVVSLLALHLLLVPLLIVFVLNMAEQNYKDRFVDQARSDALWIQVFLETLPANADRQMVLDELVLNTFRQSIQLYDAHGSLLAGAGTLPDPTAGGQQEDYTFGQHGDGRYWIRQPLRHPGAEKKASLWLSYDETPIISDTDKLFHNSLQLGILYLLAAITVVALFSRRLAFSLGQLSSAAHRVASGDYTVHFRPHNQTTEIMELAADLEHMRTELVDRGRRLDEQRRYLHALMENIAEGVVTFNRDGLLISCNPAAAQMFACPLPLAEGQKITNWIPDLRLPIETEVSMLPVAHAFLGHRQDGIFTTIELTASPVSHQGEHRYVALIRDISERKRVEEAQQKRREQLAQLRRLSSLGEMAAGLAHELNQPLAAVNLYIQGALRRLADFRDCPTDIKNAIENAALQSQRAGNIISQIRDFVRKAPDEPVETDINRLITETLKLVELDLTATDSRLQLDLADDLPTLETDPLQIQQVLVNLISNGLEAMRETTGDKQLTIRTRRIDNAVSIAVEDRGKGVPEDRLDQLFTPFFTDKKNGLGLGLSISRTVVEEHGGQLNYSRGNEGGSRFTVTLPVNRQ